MSTETPWFYSRMLHVGSSTGSLLYLAHAQRLNLLLFFTTQILLLYILFSDSDSASLPKRCEGHSAGRSLP